MNLIVIGIGQSLRGDDAVGLEAVRQWREKYPETANRPEVRVEASELPGLNLLTLLEGVDAAILVDAVHSLAPAGTIHRVTPAQLSSFASDAQSAHGWGVAETLALAEKLGLPIQNVQVRIVGIEAAQVEIGQTLSAEIEQALDLACASIEEEVRSFLH